MNKTQEALKMAIEALDNACMKIEKWTKGGKWTAGKEASLKCKEALKNIEVGDAEIKQMLDDIEYYQKRVEELEQPAQEPVAYIHRNEWNEYRLEPMDDFNITTIPWNVDILLYTHPAQSWQGLSISDEDDFIQQCYMIKTESEAHQLVLDIEKTLRIKNAIS